MDGNAFLRMNNIIYRRTGSVLPPETNCSAIWEDLLSDERNALVCEGIARFVKALPYGVIELVQNGNVITFNELSEIPEVTRPDQEVGHHKHLKEKASRPSQGSLPEFHFMFYSFIFRCKDSAFNSYFQIF